MLSSSPFDPAASNRSPGGTTDRQKTRTTMRIFLGFSKGYRRVIPEREKGHEQGGRVGGGWGGAKGK